MPERKLFLAAVDTLNNKDLEGMREVVHPEFVFHPIRAGMTGEYRGYAGMAKFLADNDEVFDRFHAEYDELRVLDDGRIFACGQVRIRGLGSRVDTLVTTAGIGTFRDGRLASWHDYGDRAAALEAAGLSE